MPLDNWFVLLQQVEEREKNEHKEVEEGMSNGKPSSRCDVRNSDITGKCTIDEIKSTTSKSSPPAADHLSLASSAAQPKKKKTKAAEKDAGSEICPMADDKSNKKFGTVKDLDAAKAEVMCKVKNAPASKTSDSGVSTRNEKSSDRRGVSSVNCDSSSSVGSRVDDISVKRQDDRLLQPSVHHPSAEVKRDPIQRLEKVSPLDSPPTEKKRQKCQPRPTEEMVTVTTNAALHRAKAGSRIESVDNLKPSSCGEINTSNKIAPTKAQPSALTQASPAVSRSTTKSSPSVIAGKNESSITIKRDGQSTDLQNRIQPVNGRGNTAVVSNNVDSLSSIKIPSAKNQTKPPSDIVAKATQPKVASNGSNCANAKGYSVDGIKSQPQPTTNGTNNIRNQTQFVTNGSSPKSQTHMTPNGSIDKHQTHSTANVLSSLKNPTQPIANGTNARSTTQLPASDFSVKNQPQLTSNGLNAKTPSSTSAMNCSSKQPMPTTISDKNHLLPAGSTSKNLDVLKPSNGFCIKTMLAPTVNGLCKKNLSVSNGSYSKDQISTNRGSNNLSNNNNLFAKPQSMQNGFKSPASPSAFPGPAHNGTPSSVGDVQRENGFVASASLRRQPQQIGKPDEGNVKSTNRQTHVEEGKGTSKFKQPSGNEISCVREGGQALTVESVGGRNKKTRRKVKGKDELKSVGKH